MTHPAHTPASQHQRLPPADATGRALRARIEPMTVRPLRDRRYVVETDGGTYVVDVERRTCTCPDHSIRGARCKHLRRVAIEITEGRIPAPHERPAVCAVCGDETFVPLDATGPQLCERHDFAPGDLVRDRETGAVLVVVRAIAERADEWRTGQNRTVSEYETNRHYGGHEPVFEAVYLDADPVGVASVESADDGRKSTPDGADSPSESLEPRGHGKGYGFPASRLQPIQRGYVPSEAVDYTVDGGAAQAARFATG